MPHSRILPTIQLDEGGGGAASQRLLGQLFFRAFGAEPREMDDAAIVYAPPSPAFSPAPEFSPAPYGLAMSTDSFTVEPLEFPGGDIGCLAVYGSVNDVAMLGARPEFLSCAFILEEGLERALLERIVASMAQAAALAGVRIVTGDTKVVPKGAADKLFINTTALGPLLTPNPPRGQKAEPGDVLLVSGPLGDHGLTIMAGRANLSLASSLQSDCAPLNRLTEALVTELDTELSAEPGPKPGAEPGRVHVLRDPSRGGLAATLNEIAAQSGLACLVEENALPIRQEVRDGCAVLGLDPLYLANEGKLVCVLPPHLAEAALNIMRRFPQGREAARIGEFHAPQAGGLRAGQVVLRTGLGGKRLLAMPEGIQLPRIC